MSLVVTLLCKPCVCVCACRNNLGKGSRYVAVVLQGIVRVGVRGVLGEARSRYLYVFMDT